MTDIAVSREGCQFGFLVVTIEAARVCQWPSLEGPFLQPESLADVFRRLRNEFIIRFALGVVRLMTIGAI